MIKLRHRTDCEKVILFILLIIFIEGTVSILIPEIHPIYYLVDVLNIILVIVMIASKKIAFLYRTGLKNFMVCFSSLYCCKFLEFYVTYLGNKRYYGKFIFFYGLRNV